MAGSPVLLAQKRRLSAAEIARAAGTLRAVRQIEEGRAAHVAERGLDPAFSLPGGVYEEPDPVTGPTNIYRRVAQHLLQTPEHFNRLRFFTFVFTGFSLLHHQRSTAVSERYAEAFSIPDSDADRWLAELVSQTENGPVAAIWRPFSAMTPEDIQFRPPVLCGEVGWETDGIVVNQDTMAYQERNALFHQLGLLRFLEEKIAERATARVLEIAAATAPSPAT